MAPTPPLTEEKPVVDTTLLSMVQELQERQVRQPKYENDVKERLTELLFGFGLYQEKKETYNANELESLAYVPMWMWGLLGLAENDESRAYQRNPSLKQAAGDFLIAPNPFYFDYSRFTDEPWRICQAEPCGFRLCIYWIHPVLQELSPYFSRRPCLIKDFKASGLRPGSVLYKLCQKRLEEGDLDNSYFGPLNMYESQSSVPVKDLLMLGGLSKYLYTWQDLDATDIPMLKQLQSDTLGYLGDVFKLDVEETLQKDDNVPTMCFHTTTAVRNPLLLAGSNRAQYLHLHLQVYANGYVPSMSCMQRSIILPDLLWALRRGQTGRVLPHTYYDETAIDEQIDHVLSNVMLTSTRFFPEDSIEAVGNKQLLRTLAEYYGLGEIFSRWPFADVFKLVRRAWTGSHKTFPQGWTLDQRRRTNETACQLTVVMGCKGSGKTTYGRQLILGRGGSKPAIWLDGSQLQFFRSEYFRTCPSTERFQFKMCLYRWALLRGLDVIVSTSNTHGTVEELTQIYAHELKHATHTLKYNVDVHVVAAKWSVCHDGVLSRNRKGDSGPSSKTFHKRGYLGLVRLLSGDARKKPHLQVLSELVLVDNNHRDVADEVRVGDLVPINWTDSRPAADVLKVFLHASLGDHKQFDFTVMNRRMPPSQSMTCNDGHGKNLLVIRGPPAVGKTTMWKRFLGQPTGAPLDSDYFTAAGSEGLPYGPWYVIDGECYCEQYREFWEMPAGDVTICSPPARRSRDEWKSASLDEALAVGASIIYPLTDNCAKAEEVQNFALSHGYAVRIWVIIVDFDEVLSRLEDRSQRHGTPMTASFDDFIKCYKKIYQQYGEKGSMDVWTYKRGTWTQGIDQLLNTIQSKSRHQNLERLAKCIPSMNKVQEETGTHQNSRILS